MDIKQDLEEFVNEKGTGGQVLRIDCPSFETIDIKEESVKSPISTNGSPFLLQMTDIPVCTASISDSEIFSDK